MSKDKALRELVAEWRLRHVTPEDCAEEVLAILDAPAEEVPQCNYCNAGWALNRAEMLHRHPEGTRFVYRCTAASPAEEVGKGLSEEQVEAILCSDVYDINDDPDTSKLTKALNVARRELEFQSRAPAEEVGKGRQLIAYQAELDAARAQAFEEAAKLCDDRGFDILAEKLRTLAHETK